MLKATLSTKDKIIIDTPSGERVEITVNFVGQMRTELFIEAERSIEINRLEHPDNTEGRRIRRMQR